jgi:hypothetical protein
VFRFGPDGSIFKLSGTWAAGRAIPDPAHTQARRLDVAILVVGAAAGVTAEQDAALAKSLYPVGSLPAGFRIRMAGPTADGWRIMTLWDSEEDWQRFRDEKLVPALAGIGLTLAAVEIWPVETVLTVWEL